MKIKRVDIVGFKSFHDKVSLDFQQCITGIVGPNGCGKSNVVDAIRWVMGEQSAKNLRGKQMEDIIFGGSESRKPLGMAEVSLVFSTEDGRVPAKYLSFSEIQVTRRLYRDGESEYLLNKSPCRLLDIAELFMDTGVGARAYSIIEQGKIGMILHSKPEERRVLIEEAAGVTKFKARKQVALKKIDLTRNNLLRITDIISEIKRQLGGLQRQAKKAEKFRECREELKEIEILFSVKKYVALVKEKEELDRQLELLQKELSVQIVDQERGELVFAQQRLTLAEHEERIQKAQEEIYRIKGELLAGESRREFHRKELENLDRLVERSRQEHDSCHLRHGEAQTELAALHEQKTLLLAELEHEAGLLVESERLLEESTRTEQGASAKIEETRNELFQVLSANAQSNNKLTTDIKRLESLAEKYERNRREIVKLQEQRAEAFQAVSRLETTSKNIKDTKNQDAEEMNCLAQREVELKSLLSAAETDLNQKRNRFAAQSSRLKSLQELEAQFAGYGQGVQTLLSNEQFKSRFKGMVADMVETGEAFEAAVEVALGEKLQWLVCHDDTDALHAVAHLREVSGGRCSFVLQHPTRPQQVAASPEAAPLLDNVTIAGQFRAYIEPLLADTYLVADLDTALVLGKKFPQLMFVTSQGDMVHSGAIVNGGSPEAAYQGLIHKKREIKELTQEAELLSQQIAQLEELRIQLKEEFLATGEGLREIRQQLHQAEIALLNAEKDLTRAREEVERLDERASVSLIENEQLDEEKLLLDREISDLREILSGGDERKSVLEQELAHLQQSWEVRKERIADVREAVTDRKVKVASLKEKADAIGQDIARVESSMAVLKQQAENHAAEVEKSVLDREKLLLAIDQSEELLKSLLDKQAALEGSYNALKEEYDAELGAHREDEAQQKKLREMVVTSKETISAHTLNAAQIAMHLSQLETHVLDKFRLGLAEMLPQYDTIVYDEAEKLARQSELLKTVEDMGDVNLTAIEEFQELEKRYQFLDEQKADLEESLRSLQKAIQRINKTTRRRFLETFHLVNEKFQEVFPRLFCGGRAELKLTNEDDLLESGLEIIVQPPGKKLQNVTLLSGGEKALSAVALIFSLFLIKPTPFCLLDEVDAPLDDANIGRFNEMVKEMSQNSQFIIITHNKTTMAVVDTLYGVTMEEPGVSKLVSVKLN
ncbi:chromosome segregation protein SMC [Geotalea sp. SG265]|uniref:chromosome segregation protein SMC n=1 Tax=Geotalea sp. SG265 TaxID=2922867 RepID=UPI001FAF5F0C|nr:chromosome segregation protein SMC [Geotalea sp. SG265]